MTQNPLPFPPLEPLTRLQAQDSLRIDAERWALAHNYHRQRQNLHYQALWQPGIVCGLGVKAIAPPSSARSQFRDRRWVQIQPGIAIDNQGNPIVVSPSPVENRTYRLAIPDLIHGNQTVHLVISHVDPESLELSERAVAVAEQFRLDECLGVLKPGDVELCRIQLAPGAVVLESPKDPFNPGINELDLRYRAVAQLRPQTWVKVGTLGTLVHENEQNWRSLLENLPFICPAFGSDQTIHRVKAITEEALSEYDLVIVPEPLLGQWQTEDRSLELETLRHFLRQGGTLFLESQTLSPNVEGVMARLTDSDSPEPISFGHPLTRYPFRFGTLPLGAGLYCEAGLVVALPPLSDAWAGRNLLRHEIQAAQEVGANLLYFAWQRRHFAVLMY